MNAPAMTSPIIHTGAETAAGRIWHIWYLNDRINVKCSPFGLHWFYNMLFLQKNERKDLRMLDGQALRYNAQKLRKSEFKAKIAAFCYY